MKTKFVVKDFKTQLYYCGPHLGWTDESMHLVEYFDTREDAVRFISTDDGFLG